MAKANELKEIEKEESRIILEERKIQKDEKKIAKEEDKIVNIEQTLKEVTRVRLGFLRKFAKHKFIFSLVGGIGVVLVWRGLWDISETIPGLESSAVALVVGLLIIWFLEKYTDI